MRNASTQKQQAGLSLVELMISITLGLLLMTAAVQSLLGTQKSYSVNDDLSRAQENGRIALDLLVKNIRMAGYRNPNNGQLPAFFVTTACGGFDPCTHDDVGVGANSDRIAVQFDPPPDDGTELDCVGNTVAATDIIANVYDITTTAGVSSLSCRSFDVSTGVMGNTQPLVDGIDSMHILYGVGTGDAVTEYVSADRVADWATVKSVRLSLLVSNGSVAGSSENRQRSYVVLDSNTYSPTDSHMRYIYTTTAYLNNSAQDNL